MIVRPTKVMSCALDRLFDLRLKELEEPSFSKRRRERVGGT